MKPNDLRSIQKLSTYINKLECPAVIEAFRDKDSSEKPLMIIDMIVFIINIIFFCYVFWYDRHIEFVKVFAFINSLVVLNFQFLCKRQTYDQIIKVNIDIKQKKLEIISIKFIKLAHVIKITGWILIGLTLVLLTFGMIINTMLYRILIIISVIDALIYGVMDKFVWNFFSINNADIRRLVGVVFSNDRKR